jgi:hypothetical protein
VASTPAAPTSYFPHHRELLGGLSRAAAETAKEFLAAAAGEKEGFRSGRLSVVQTFGGRANFHPHVHALVTRGRLDGLGRVGPGPVRGRGGGGGAVSTSTPAKADTTPQSQGTRILPLGSAVAGIYARVWAQLESKGRPTGPLDLMIGAHALSLDERHHPGPRAPHHHRPPAPRVGRGRPDRPPARPPHRLRAPPRLHPGRRPGRPAGGRPHPRGPGASARDRPPPHLLPRPPKLGRRPHPHRRGPDSPRLPRHRPGARPRPPPPLRLPPRADLPSLEGFTPLLGAFGPRRVRRGGHVRTVLAKRAGATVKVSFFGAITIGRLGEPETTEDGVVRAASFPRQPRPLRSPRLD